MPSDPPRFRHWLRSDMRTMRWVFLGLYLSLLGALVAFLVWSDSWEALATLLGIQIGGQVLFVGVAGTMQLCRPIVKRRLIVPVAVAALMLTSLLVGLVLALSELFYFDKSPLSGSAALLPIFWLCVVGSWIGWGVLLYAHVKRRPRYEALQYMTNRLFVGSLLELTATVPSHLIVSRRPGCLVGLWTMLGIIAGLNVMLFAFGPMILLLFLRPRHRRERDISTPYCANCGYDLRASRERCPECGEAIAV